MNIVTDQNTFTKFYGTHFQTYALLAMQYVDDIFVAEDIVQNVFIKFWETPGVLENASALKAYLGRMVINSAINHLKRNKDLERHHNTIISELKEQDVYQQFYEQELKVAIYKEIDLLPEKCKQVFKLSRFDGLKYKEIAQILDLSERTVENHIANALKVLRKKIFSDKIPKNSNISNYKLLLILMGA
ncbi:MAG: RNA polymerase sigma-70 factor [Mucilaginibacter sp.]|uniref:RNA polymerase sigma-70 factor n=1 Tax=Mucilaginibacter sp. TaxID=1882438 RepID=UPI00356467A8